MACTVQFMGAGEKGRFVTKTFDTKREALEAISRLPHGVALIKKIPLAGGRAYSVVEKAKK